MPAPGGVPASPPVAVSRKMVPGTACGGGPLGAAALGGGPLGSAAPPTPPTIGGGVIGAALNGSPSDGARSAALAAAAWAALASAAALALATAAATTCGGGALTCARKSQIESYTRDSPAQTYVRQPSCSNLVGTLYVV